MARTIVVAVAVGALSLSGSFAAAQQKPQIKQATIKVTSPPYDGKAMFTEYCTPCHGKAGKGDGPAALALKKVPADLTKISARNNGAFPEVRVSRFIEGLDEIAAHGSRDMPVWGPLFRTLPGGSDTAPIRIKSLVEYLKSIQQ